MDEAVIWQDYGHLVLYPILAGTALMIVGGLARELLGRWFYG